MKKVIFSVGIPGWVIEPVRCVCGQHAGYTVVNPLKLKLEQIARQIAILHRIGIDAHLTLEVSVGATTLLLDALLPAPEVPLETPAIGAAGAIGLLVMDLPPVPLPAP